MTADERPGCTPVDTIRSLWRTRGSLPRAAQTAAFLVAYATTSVLRRMWGLGANDAVELEHALRWWGANLSVFTVLWIAAGLVAGLICLRNAPDSPADASSRGRPHPMTEAG